MSPIERPPIDSEFKDAVEHNPTYGQRGRKTPPFSLRLTAEEKARLRAEAGSTPLGAYIRTKLLGGASRPRRQHRRPVADEKALARLLGALGEARIANNLNQLAKAVNKGSLAATPETDKALQDACRDIAWMRAILMTALGKKDGS